MRSILAFVRTLMQESVLSSDTDYRDGYVAALEEVEEFILDQLWERGDDGEDRS